MRKGVWEDAGGETEALTSILRVKIERLKRRVNFKGLS
jgi:hypothetical protein